MGKSIYPMGGPSLGFAFKLCSNYLTSLTTLETSEAINLAMRLGLDPEVFSECLKTSSGGNEGQLDDESRAGSVTRGVTSKGYEGSFKVSW